MHTEHNDAPRLRFERTRLRARTAELQAEIARLAELPAPTAADRATQRRIENALACLHERLTEVEAELAAAAARGHLVEEPVDAEPVWSSWSSLGTSERDARNRRVVRQRIERLTAEISVRAADGRATAVAREERRSYRRVLAAVSGSAQPRASLVCLDTVHAPPLAAVALGNPATADHVTFLVPGMGWTSDGLTGWTLAGRNLLAAQQRLAPGDEHAVIAWIGYETPSTKTVRSHGHAQRGGRQLAADIHDLCASRDDSPVVSVVAHSYGTATAARALVESTCFGRVRTLVCLGSAGIEPELGDVKALAADRVFAAEAPPPSLPFLEGTGDHWAFIGRNVSGRIDPRDPAFGAETLDITASGGLHPVRSHSAVPRAEGLPWHGYLDAGTASLEAAARATVEGICKSC